MIGAYLPKCLIQSKIPYGGVALYLAALSWGEIRTRSLIRRIIKEQEWGIGGHRGCIGRQKMS